MRSLWWSVIGVSCVVAVTAAGVAFGDRAPALSTDRTGDAALVERVEPLLDGVRDRASVCFVTAEEIRYAHFGSDERRVYEIASITKTFTGELLADSVARGEVTLQTPVGDIIDLDGTALASVTLQELATHHSGLGEWADDERDDTLARWWTEDVRGGTVHDIGLDEFLDRLRADPLATRGSYSYSNAGVALLGHALAIAAGTDYRTLLQTRVIAPLGLDRTGLTSDSAPNRPRGHDESGRLVPPWTLGAYAPAGGGYSTIRDLCTYAQALMTRETGDTGPNARVPMVDGDGHRMGLGWEVTEIDGDQVAFKTGRTGGFASTIAIAPDRAVVVLTNTGTPVDGVVSALIKDGP